MTALSFFSSSISIIESGRDLESGGGFNFLNFESKSWESIVKLERLFCTHKNIVDLYRRLS